MERHTGPQTGFEPRSSPLNREVVRDAHQWLVRFSPLLDEMEALRAEECRDRLRVIPALRDSGDRVALRLKEHGDADDAPLLQTLQGALRELDALEEELRRRLARVDPDDPQSSVDLDSLQARLAEAAARREVVETVGYTSQPTGMEVRTSAPNWGAALMMGLFSFGWLSFTTVHAFFMIGGMSRAFGWMALGLLGFYAIFFAVGIGMAWGAVMSACEEHLSVEGDELVLTRRLLGQTWKKRHKLGRDSRAHVTLNVTRHNNSGAVSSFYAYVLDREGREIKFGAGRPKPELDRTVSQLNECLEAGRNLRAHA
jgi:hypothetical protein